MRNPIPDSYWLIEGQLLAGEYPGAPDDDEARLKLEALLAAGIRSFIDLTELADARFPYETILTEIAREMGIDIRYERHPIRDMWIPPTDVMADILATIREEIAAGRPVYFHCWGGIGRTGTVAGCWLVGQGHSCDEALDRIRELRAGTPDGWMQSPQTDLQREFVRSWRRK